MAQATKASAFTKVALGMQTFLLRHNWIGGMSNFIMVITTSGRKSGKQYSTPIGYIYDSDDLISLNPNGVSNWYRNVLSKPDVKLNIKGVDYSARGEHITDQKEKERLFEIYKRDYVKVFPRLFGVTVDAPADELAKALASREIVRFKLSK